MKNTSIIVGTIALLLTGLYVGLTQSSQFIVGAVNVSVPQSTGYGQVLIGNAVGGGYTPVATSSLGISSSGTVSTSTTETKGFLSYWTSSAGTPALLGQVATTSLTATSPLSLSQAISVIGASASALSISTTTNSLFTGTAGQVLGYTSAGWTGVATTTYSGGLTYSAGNVTNTLTAGDGLTRNTDDFDCDTASGSVFGCLSSTDWNTFNGKENALTFSFPLIRSVNAISFGGLSTSTAAVVGNLPYFSGVNTFANVATSSLAVGGSITSSGTLGAQVGGTNTSLSLNMGNANTWTALQTFANATTTLLSIGTGWIPTLGTAAGAFLAVDANGKIIATTTPSSGGTPGGSNTQIQFNDGGNFGGSADFTWTNAKSWLTVASSTVGGSFTFAPGSTAGRLILTDAPSNFFSEASDLASRFEISIVSGDENDVASLYLQASSTNGYSAELAAYDTDARLSLNDGEIFLSPLQDSEINTLGRFLLSTHGSSDQAIFDTRKLVTTDKTFSFPDVTGTLGVGVATTSSSLAYWGSNSGLYSVATTSPSFGLGLTGGGTWTVLGSAPTLNVATSSLYSGTTGQLPYFSGTNALTATSSIFLAANGRVGIASSTPLYKLSVTGTVAFDGLTTAAGTPSSICMDATTKEITVNAALTCTVSARDQKQNIQPLDFSGIEMISLLNPVSFAYNDNPDRIRYGFIADEVQSVSPQLGDGYIEDEARTIDIPALISLTIKSVQEIIAKISGLEARLDEQQKQIDELRKQIDALRYR